MKRSLAILVGLSSLALLAACARTSATTWGWSSWYRRGGFGDMGAFEAQRSTCLAQLGTSDPASIQPQSPQETQFIQCMNGSGWCTQLWDCNKPGA